METGIGLMTTALGALNPGHLTLSLIRPALDLFRSETVAPNLSAMMVVVALVLMLVHCFRCIRPACNSLDRRVTFLRGCTSPADFYSRIDQFDSLMSSERFLAHGWSEFIDTCLFTNKDGVVNIEISIRPDVYINLEDAEHSGLSIKWFHGLSGIFVGIGLLLTFIGLVAALYFSSSAINLVIDGASGIAAADQTKAIQRALAQLLNTATFKFLTSIAGLGCSIVLGFYDRKWANLLEEKFQDLCCELERCTLVVTPEQLANRQYLKQCVQTELLHGLPDTLIKGFERVVGKALSPVVEKLDEAIQAIISTRQAPLQAMIEEFGTAVSAAAGREMRAVAETMAVLPDQISFAASDLQRVLSELILGLDGLRAHVLLMSPAPRNDDPLVIAAREVGDGVAALRSALVDASAQRDLNVHANHDITRQLSLAVLSIENSGAANVAAIAELLDHLRAQSLEAHRTLSDEQTRSERSANDIADRFLDAVRATQEVSAEQSARVEDAISKIVTAGLTAGH
ncbi:MAG: hypothetical protein WCK65_00700, partial [Rhodospirillaceae bacterium]